MTLPTTTAPQRSSIGTRICDRFDAPLPRGIREEANEMSWESVIAEYGHCAGPLRLGHWECTDVHRPASRLGPQARHYQATIAMGDRITTSTAAAAGPVAALTEMLHNHGIALEMLRFHQLHSGEHTATFIRGTDGIRAQWAVGWSDDSTLSALRAVIACANRLCAD
ncbi:homocitrate synthase [Mycolicibacterium komossense]|uniref:Homocitrate synthase n=1 Tax=Mycolicibacterium komossense TaxID=1779 RepID=A0ABT3CG95_9MYCO|nr:homocitrate synthase [Mycolicibacterium komossense]MCV7228516.1 homocitrate synthase [Mycolicibacterium komossense]